MLTSASSEKRVDGCNDGRIVSTREKLILDLKTEIDGTKNVILSDGEKRDEKKTATPWNLRKHNCSSIGRPDASVKLQQIRSSSGKTETVKFSVQLSKTEIEDDFMKMLGQKPPRKPKKWPRDVQNHLDTLFPGLSSLDVTADLYKVFKTTEKGKVGRSGKKA
ncbi:hypothetical protein VNO77_39549 [Canavalia gladiata]|uniref:Uncharacterized protein n=1 Tax=Canavalia gladiata TaxID=3824 RepID=A0AAN9PP60_CANGL